MGDASYRFERVQGPTVVMVAKPFEPFPEDYFTAGVPVSISSVRRNAPNALDPSIKSCNLLNNILAVREAQAKGSVEALLLNASGQLAEGASSNFFGVNDSRLLTPPLSAGILRIPAEWVMGRLGTSDSSDGDSLAVDDLLSAEEAPRAHQGSDAILPRGAHATAGKGRSRGGSRDYRDYARELGR